MFWSKEVEEKKKEDVIDCATCHCLINLDDTLRVEDWKSEAGGEYLCGREFYCHTCKPPYDRIVSFPYQDKEQEYRKNNAECDKDGNLLNGKNE